LNDTHTHTVCTARRTLPLAPDHFVCIGSVVWPLFLVFIEILAALLFDNNNNTSFMVLWIVVMDGVLGDGVFEAVSSWWPKLLVMPWYPSTTTCQ